MVSLPEDPNTRLEKFYNALATGDLSGLPEPITREETYLYIIAKNGGGGGGGDVTGVKGAAEDEYRKGNVNIKLPDVTNLGDGLKYDPGEKELSVSALTNEEVGALVSLL